MAIDIARTCSLRIKETKGVVLDGTVCICMKVRKSKFGNAVSILWFIYPYYF
jgi:hypothetical protein